MKNLRLNSKDDLYHIQDFLGINKPTKASEVIIYHFLSNIQQSKATPATSDINHPTSIIQH